MIIIYLFLDINKEVKTAYAVLILCCSLVFGAIVLDTIVLILAIISKHQTAQRCCECISALFRITASKLEILISKTLFICSQNIFSGIFTINNYSDV